MTTVQSVHHVYNPLLLTRKPITVEEDVSGGVVLGMVSTNLLERPHNTYKLYIFNRVIKYFWEVSPYSKTALRIDAFKLGVLDHECSHVWWGTCDMPVVEIINNPIARDIDNILSDTADEYRTMKKYPVHAKYIQLVLSCVKWDTLGIIKGTWIDQDLHSLFLLTRFGVIAPGSDENFVSFIFPHVVSSRRGDRKNTIDAVLAIYTYMQTKAQQTPEMQKQWQQGISSTQDSSQSPLTGKEIDAILKGKRVDDSSVPFELLKEAVTGQQQQGKISLLGKLAGTDGPPPDDDETTDEFYRTTCGLYPGVIMSLDHMWMQRKHKLNKYMRVDEGRVPRRKKRQAYRDARTGEQHRTHVGLKRQKPKIRVGILGDVSHSTEGIKTQYARAIVCLLASLDRKDDVKTALAFFNSQYKVIMQFGDAVRRAKIRPQAYGGTVLHPLLDEVDTWSWDGKENYLVVITDGDIEYWHTRCLPKLYQLAQKNIVIVLVELVEDASVRFIRGAAGNSVPAWLHSFATTLETMPENIMDAITVGGKR